jgi:dihydrofolate reductase
MYETMAVWETMPLEGEPQLIHDYAQIWRAADKIVYSRTLAEVTSARTRLERVFDAGAVRAMKRAAPHDISIGGAGLAGAALAANIVDEVGPFLMPISVGGGTPALPRNVRFALALADQRRFNSGVVYVRYRTLY